jgi:hypothetical protein
MGHDPAFFFFLHKTFSLIDIINSNNRKSHVSTPELSLACAITLFEKSNYQNEFFFPSSNKQFRRHLKIHYTVRREKTYNYAVMIIAAADNYACKVMRSNLFHIQIFDPWLALKGQSFLAWCLTIGPSWLGSRLESKTQNRRHTLNATQRFDVNSISRTVVSYQLTVGGDARFN